MPLAMLLADRRPARIMAQPFTRVETVSLPGVVQREIDGVLARNSPVCLHANVSPECPRAGALSP